MLPHYCYLVIVPLLGQAAVSVYGCVMICRQKQGGESFDFFSFSAVTLVKREHKTIIRCQ